MMGVKSKRYIAKCIPPKIRNTCPEKKNLYTNAHKSIIYLKEMSRISKF